jgi:DNA-binding MarR family transcriptional regulator
VTATPEQTHAPHQLGFLLARHGQIMNGRLRQALGGCNLSPRHGAVLLRLAQTGSAGQQALIEELSIDPSTLVAILNDLESDGALERRRDPADRRRHIVEITDSGTRGVCAVEKAIAEVEADAFADLDEAETAQLRALLAKVRTRPEGSACSEA